MNSRMEMKSMRLKEKFSRGLSGLWTIAVLGLLLPMGGLLTTAQTTKKAVAPARGEGFESPQAAADALVDAAEKYDVTKLEAILGPHSHDIVATGEPARDKERAKQFVDRYRAKHNIAPDPKNARHEVLSIGDEDWPFPVPMIKEGPKWYFDSSAGLHEILLRRVGQNELDAIQICRGYVEAQNEYALTKKKAGEPNQYAQKIISADGDQNALAWKNADGSWDGPIGEKIAGAITKGYGQGEPYHGYYFKIL